MNHLDICVADITKKFRDQANLRDFVFHYVLKKNDVLGTRMVVNQEHLYTLEELLMVLNIDEDYYFEFKKFVELKDAKIEIHQNVYYSLPKLIKYSEFIENIASLTRFATQEA